MKTRTIEQIILGSFVHMLLNGGSRRETYLLEDRFRVQNGKHSRQVLDGLLLGTYKQKFSDQAGKRDGHRTGTNKVHSLSKP